MKDQFPLAFPDFAYFVKIKEQAIFVRNKKVSKFAAPILRGKCY